MFLGFVYLVKITSLCGCYLVTKEDQSMFVDREHPIYSDPEQIPSTKRQLMLDRDYHGFVFAPQYQMERYKNGIEHHGSTWVGKDGEKIAGNLFFKCVTLWYQSMDGIPEET